MRKSKWYQLLLPERRCAPPDPANIEDLTGGLEIIDSEMHRMETDKAGRDELQRHAVKSVLDHPDSSVTDDKIGDRTIGGLKGKLTALFAALGNAIKAIAGTANWNDPPATNLRDAKLHIDDNTRHITGTERLRWNDTYTVAQTDGKLKVVQDDVTAHKARRDNPHTVTKAQAGLGNADNTSDVHKPVSTAQAAAIKVVQDDVTAHKANTYTKVQTDVKFASKADLDVAGKVPAAQLPSYVDDVLEVSTYIYLPAVGESGKIYIVQDTNKTYRWSGSAYVVISETLAIGETSATAYRGDRGKLAYDHMLIKGDVHGVGLATAEVNGLMSKEKMVEVAANTAARHTHANKALIDTYTQTDANVKSAVDQKHSHANKAVIDGITAVKVTSWDGKVDKVSGKQLTTEDYTAGEKTKLAGIASNANNYVHPATHPASMITGLPEVTQTLGTTTTKIPCEKAVVDAITASGGGDMLKSVYDTNGNGLVDNAEKVNGLTVQTAVPLGAKFTDTIYTHPATHPYSMLTGTPPSAILLAAYPVGSIYFSANNTNPASLFGGTWVAWGAGRVPVGVGSNGTTNYAAANVAGGVDSVALSVANQALHTHAVRVTGSVSAVGDIGVNASGVAVHNQAAFYTNADGGHSHWVTSSDGRKISWSNGSIAGQVKITAATASVGGSNFVTEAVGGHAHVIPVHGHATTPHAHTTGGHGHDIDITSTSSGVGSGAAHENRMPYITCYMWQRTA